MKKVKLPRLLEGLPLATLGALIFAVAVAFFYDPSRLAPGGISGIAVIISHITSVPTGTLIFAMNIPLLILAWRRFGRRFVFLTVYATALSSLAMDLLAPFAAQAAPHGAAVENLARFCEKAARADAYFARKAQELLSAARLEGTQAGIRAPDACRVWRLARFPLRMRLFWKQPCIR